MKHKIKLGTTVRDEITGFTGSLECIAYWRNGCERVTVQSRVLKDGLPQEPQHFDIQQVKEVKGETVQEGKPRGGPMPNPQRR